LVAILSYLDKKKTLDLSLFEIEGMFLVCTGSMVMDRVNKIAYACESPRTNKTVLDDFCKQLGYTPVLFKAADADGMEIYHTNVMMHVGSEVAVVCMDSIQDDAQRAEVRESLESTGKTIVEITFDQMNHFAGNMLELHNKDGEPCLIMSLTAYESLTQEQIGFLESKMTLITPDLDCIEQNGGGSARCMIAEIF
ncbi:MAG: arginine deiminase-related protein, partial [Bacillota bacterium]|nr:arginine deiminase-related protein [Bacillota bacterium]